MGLVADRSNIYLLGSQTIPSSNPKSYLTVTLTKSGRLAHCDEFHTLKFFPVIVVMFEVEFGSYSDSCDSL